MSLANSSILWRYKPVNLSWPNQSYIDCHHWRWQSFAPAVQKPLSSPEVHLSHPGCPPGGEMAFLWRPIFEVCGSAAHHNGDVIPITSAGFRLDGAKTPVLQERSSQGYPKPPGTITCLWPPDICILYSPFLFGQPNFHKPEWLFCFWEIKPLPSQF